MLGLISTTDGSGNTSYYLPDGLGSTSQLTNSAGTITDRYAYDAFGATRSQSGATANDWRFTGQQQDYNANRGLYDLRARMYDPALGRFLQRDPLPFVQRYAYAGDNPANYVDPRGLCSSWLCPFPIPASPQGIVDWTENALHDLKTGLVDPVVTATGYVDLNATVCVPGPDVCGTAGVQVSIRQGPHLYAGTAVGGGAGASFTWAPGQSISQGWGCGLQAGYGFVSGQFGAAGIKTVKNDKEGRNSGSDQTPFGEVGFGFGAVSAITCFYVR